MDLKNKSAKWLRNNSVLVLIDADGNKIVPSAMEIYQAEFKQIPNIVGNLVTPPSLSIDGLSFSRYPLKLRIDIEINEETALLKGDRISLKIICTRGEIQAEISDPLTRIANHMIIGDVWYPFEQEALDELKEILMKGNIKQEEKISLKQYFYLSQLDTELVKINYKEFIIPDRTQSPKTYLPLGTEMPSIFEGKLYPYQAAGYRWLRMIENEDIGCILADEMGLGKTIQLICLLAYNILNEKKPSLVIAPATLLDNWRREIWKFTPAIKTYLHRGSERTRFPSDFRMADVVITSYSTAIRDIPILKMVPWDTVILDEAQAIKNPEAKRTRLVKDIKRRISIAVTGTPIQNVLTDLWSILDFALPEILGDLSEFQKKYSNDEFSASKLEPIISPVILRRTVDEVAQDLPERWIISHPLRLTTDLGLEYESLRSQTLEKYGRSGNFVVLTKLRMFCTHPFLIKETSEDPARISPKYLHLGSILREIFENDEKALIFTSFQKMIDIFMEDLSLKYPEANYDYIDGRVPVSERQLKVDNFNSYEGPAVLILNPRAAGTGLNLTGANHVIHYNLEWNPAVEDQASARAYRIGQTKPVRIHRMFYINTVEEIISERLEKKRAIAASAIRGVDGYEEDSLDIIKALEVSPTRSDDCE